MRRKLVMLFCMVFAAAPVFAGETVVFKTPKDKLSYALGADMANNMKRYEIDIDPDQYMKGLKDALSGGTLLLTEQEIKTVIMAMQKDLQAKQQEKTKAQGDKNKADGEAFLAKNKSKEGVKALHSGLQYKVLVEGKGKSPKASDSVTVHYRGTLIDGTEFDSSVKRGEPATFPLNGVIKGWTEALQLMKEGAKWQLFIPANLAYGEVARPGLPPNSTLIFEVELLSIKAQ